MAAVDRIRVARIGDAGLLFLKLAALLLMVVDHVDWFLFQGGLGLNATIGRAVFPAFALVLGLNLARPFDTRDLWRKQIPRLLVFGALAHPAYTLLQGHQLPLNVMATLAVATAVVALWWTERPLSAVVVFVWAGAAVDYAWFGVGSVVVAWWMTRRGYAPLLVGLAVAALVIPFNGSPWSLLVLPLLWAASCMQGPAPRMKWLFYASYPAHLAVLALLAAAFTG